MPCAAQPQRDVGGLHGLVRDPAEVGAERVQPDLARSRPPRQALSPDAAASATSATAAERPFPLPIPSTHCRPLLSRGCLFSVSSQTLRRPEIVTVPHAPLSSRTMGLETVSYTHLTLPTIYSV